MKHVEEYRDPALVSALCERIRARVTRDIRIMEVCGGQTHSIVRHGLEQLLPPQVELLHGPGCPVCVTSTGLIDRAIALASMPGVVLCSFGDMLRVPGTQRSLLQARAAGAAVRLVYSPLEAVAAALREPATHFVLFGVGFETTAPATAMAVLRAAREGLDNFSLLVSHVLVPPALEALISDPEHRIDGLLAAGHVCTVMGTQQYAPIADRHGIPVVVTGFEPVDILHGILMCIEQRETGRAEVENQYTRAVAEKGNTAARAAVQDVFAVADTEWRGIGRIPESGLRLREVYAHYDALRRFATEASSEVVEPQASSSECIAGLVLRGLRKPADCPAFGRRCSPDNPLGAPMVSGEGACAAYYRYGGFAHGATEDGAE